MKSIVMVIVVVQAAEMANGLNARKSRSLTQLFEVQTTASVKKSSKEMKEEFFTDLKEQMGHQAETHSSVDQQLVDFDNICKKEKIETLPIWSEEYFARTYIYSSVLIDTTTKILKAEVGAHSQQILGYVKNLDTYNEKTFSGYNDNYLVIRLFGIARYAQSILEHFPINRITLGIDSKQEAFAKIVRGTEFSHQLIAQAGEQLFLESKMLKLYRASTTYKNTVAKGIKAFQALDKPSLDVSIKEKHVRSFNLLLSGDEICSTLVKLIMILTTEQHGGKGFSKLLGLRKDEGAENYLTQFYTTFNGMLKKEVDEFGQIVAKSPVTEASWDSCKLSERSQNNINTMYDILFFSQTNENPPSDSYLRQYFSRTYYLGDEDMERLTETALFKAISFDRLIMWNHDRLVELDNFTIFQNSRPLFIHKFMADFMNPLVFKGFQYDKNPIINKIINRMRFQAEIQNKVPAEKRTSTGYFLLERVLTMIYVGYSALRSGTFSDIDISALKSSSEAVDVYKLLFKMFSTSKYVLLLNEQLSGININDLPEVYTLVLGYTCHKAFGGDDSKCAVDENEIMKIFKTMRFRVTYSFTPITTITTFLVKILKKLLFEEFFVKFQEMAIKINFGEAYDVKTKQVDDKKATKPYGEFYALLKYAYSSNKDSSGQCWQWLVQYISQEENVEQHYHTVFYYFIYLFASDVTANKSKQGDFKEAKLYHWMMRSAQDSLMISMNRKIVSANVFFTQVFAMAGKQISFGLEDAEEYETFSGLVYYQMFLPASTALLLKKGGDKAAQMLGDKVDMEVMGKLNGLIKDQRVVSLAFSSVSKKGKGTNLKEFFEKDTTIADFKVRIQHIRRVQYFQAVSGFFKRYNLGTRMFYSLRQSTFQNPAAVLLNFFHLYHQFAQNYKGDEDDFYEFLFDRIKYCMEKSQFFGEQGSDDVQCPWSYRKYAELYYFVRFDIMKSTESSSSLVEYHQANENIIHARIFMAAMHNSEESKKDLDEYCLQDPNQEQQFCFAWLAKNLIWDHVKTTSAKSISTEEFNQKLFELSQDFQKLPMLKRKFGLLLAGECIDYFADQGSLTFDRYVNYFDYHKVVMNPNSKNTNDKLMTGYYTSKIYSLTTEDKKEVEIALQQYSVYLKLTFAKRTYSDDEMMTQIAVNSLLTQPKEVIEQTLKYGQYTNVYLFKVLLIFARGNDQFSKLAQILIDNEAFLETPLINNRKKDEIISNIIKYVSCSLWENETAQGKSVDNAKIFKDIRNKNKGTVCKTKDTGAATTDRAPEFVVRLRRQLGSEIIEKTVEGMDTIINSVQKDRPTNLNIKTEDQEFFEVKEETEILVDEQIKTNDVKLNSYFEKSPIKIPPQKKEFNFDPKAKAKQGTFKYQLEVVQVLEFDNEADLESHKAALLAQKSVMLDVNKKAVLQRMKEAEVKKVIGSNISSNVNFSNMQFKQARTQSVPDLSRQFSIQNVRHTKSLNFMDDLNNTGSLTVSKTVRREVSSLYLGTTTKSTSFIFNNRRIRV